MSESSSTIPRGSSLCARKNMSRELMDNVMGLY